MHTETNGSQHRETNLRSKILGSPHRKMADGSCRVERAAGSSRGESRSPRSLAAGSVCEQQSGGAAHVLFGDWGYRHAIADRFSRQGGRNRAARGNKQEARTLHLHMFRHVTEKLEAFGLLQCMFLWQQACLQCELACLEEEEKPRSKLRPRLPNSASLQARWSRGASFPSSRARPCLGPGRLRRCL